MAANLAPAAARRVVVVGGGFVGISCALHLQQAGHRVALVDPVKPGSPQQASYGNAGTFAKYANIPINKPGIAWEVPAMLMNPDGPLALKCNSHLPKMVPWGSRFLAASQEERVRQISSSLNGLLARAEMGWEPVWAQAGVDIGRHRVSNGCLYLFGSEESFQEAQSQIAVRQQVCGVEALRPAEIAALEPWLAPHYSGGFLFDAWHLKDPGSLAAEMVEGFEARGGELVQQRVSGVLPGRGVTLSHDKSLLPADEVIVCAGAHSKDLALSAGDHIPLDTERGYHVTFSGHGGQVNRPVGWADGGFYMTPMSSWLRVAGTVELGGLHAPMTRSRCDMLERGAHKLLPELPARDTNGDWMGFRPTLPDSLPVIGRSPRAPGLVYAFGHQHIGWTLGGITGQLVAELVAGVTPSVDLHPYRPERFDEFFAGEAMASPQLPPSLRKVLGLSNMCNSDGERNVRT